MSNPLEIKNVIKKFNDKTVLNDISLNIKQGEIYGLVGLNGVGKTTLIKIIIGLLSQDSGEVSIFGNNSTNPQNRNKLTYLPEKFHPSPYLRGKEFLSLNLSFYKKKLDVEEAENNAKLLDLDPRALNKMVNKYSKGMGQKLGILSSLMVNTPFIILDEPMSGLDPKARIQLKQLLLNYKKQGNTVFFSSHILADIEEICDRMAIINNGKIIFEDQPKKLLTKHKEKNLEHAFLKAIES